MFIEFSLLLDDTSGSIKNGYFESVFSNISRTYSTRLLENSETEITPEEWKKYLCIVQLAKLPAKFPKVLTTVLPF